MTTSQDATLAALREQVACYQKLAKLAEIQHNHVQQGRTEALLEVLGKREVVLGQLANLERAIAPAKGRWPEYIAGLPEADRPQAESCLAQTRALLQRITEADRDDVMVLQNQKLNIGRQIGKTNAAAAVNRTYAAAAYGAKRPQMDLRQ